jgi:uncharacterized protein (TIGR03382 family)
LLIPKVADAHGSLPSVFEIAERDAEIIGLGTTFGLIVADDSGRFRWSCADAVGELVSGYVIHSHNDIIAVTRSGVWRSTDAGCSYEKLETAVGDLPISEVRTNQGRSIVTTSSPIEPNGVFSSDDGGLSWSAMGGQMDGVALFGLAVDGERIVVSGLSADGWALFDWTAEGPELIAPLPEGTLDAELWIVEGDIWVADIIANESELHRVVGDATEQVGERLEAVITDVVRQSERVLVATDADQLYEVASGGLFLLEDVAGTCFVDLEDGTPARCGAPANEFAVHAGLVGESQGVLRFADVGPALCIADETHVCASLWPFAARLMGAPEELDAEPAPKTGCTSANLSVGGSISFSLLMAALLWRRRR